MQNRYVDRLNSVAEELVMNGYKVDVVGNEIHYDSIAGKQIYSCSEKTVMGDYYRFLSHYGLKLHNWALKQKIKESKV